MRIAENVTKLIGNTPLVKLNRLAEGCAATVAAKLEFYNPAHSVKDRIGVAMVEAMERDGKLVPGKSVIVEPTSGNTGIALAMVAAAKGYRCVIAMPESVSLERRKVLKLLGAELILTPAADGMKGAIRRALELVAEIPGAAMPQQFETPPTRRSTRPPRPRSCGGTPMGRWISSSPASGPAAPHRRGEGVEGAQARGAHRCGGAVHSAVISGGQPGPHKIQGLGAGFIPANLDTRFVDEVVKVSNDESFAMARRLAKRRDPRRDLLGGRGARRAGGGAPAGERRQARGLRRPSTSERYISTDLFAGLD